MIDSPENRAKIVNNDEVQRLPDLLDYVHQSFFESRRVFILTGSCARQLKQLETDLLAGRALVYHLQPAIGRDVGIDDSTVGDYYEILEDTLVGISSRLSSLCEAQSPAWS